MKLPDSIETVDDDVADVLRRMTPAERLAIGHGLWSCARSTSLNILRSKHPDWTDERLHEEVAQRLSQES